MSTVKQLLHPFFQRFYCDNCVIFFFFFNCICVIQISWKSALGSLVLNGIIIGGSFPKVYSVTSSIFLDLHM